MTGAVRRRAPVVAFGCAEIAAFVLWLGVGRADWFYIDEWDFLAGRKAGDLGDLFRPHNGHWTTLPVLAFRALYALFGLRTTVPYRALIIVLYLVSAALLLAVMRRAGVHPWIATSAATLFVFFGAGWENIILPFQITFVGSLVFGLAQLLLTDHDGPFDRRDALGLFAGLFGLMCSAVGIVMVAVVGIAVLVRRGRELALLHVVPAAACCSIWLVVIGHVDGAGGHFTLSFVTGFVSIGLATTFGAIGPIKAFGVVLAILGVFGLGLASIQRSRSGRRSELAAPAALVVGSLALLTITAVNRVAFTTDWARQSRYISLVAAMMLPALAVAADAITRRWRRCLPFAIALFLLGIPANLHAAYDEQHVLHARDTATRDTMLSLPLDPLAQRVPRSVRPEPTTGSAVTIGWLLDAAAHHKLPGFRDLTPALLASDDFRLSFDRPTGSMPTTNCRSSDHGIALDLHRGEKIGVYDNGVYLAPAASILVGLDLLYPNARNAPIVVVRDVGRVHFLPVSPGPFRICTGNT